MGKPAMVELKIFYHSGGMCDIDLCFDLHLNQRFENLANPLSIR